MSGPRRQLSALAALLALVAPAGCGGEPDPAAPRSGSTLEGTWVDADGNGVLERGPGEPLSDRTELAPASEPVREIASFVQLTDAHLRDEESPARAPLLDRFSPDLNSTFRPQEALSPQVLGAAIESIDELGPDAVVVTGDLIDSAQRNELDQALALLAGGRVEPDSGARGYAGPQQASNPDPFFYRPDLDAPLHPGLLDAAQRPFEAPGLDAPWFPVAGNHDLLVQGEVPSTPRLDRLATGSRMLSGIDEDVQLPDASELTPQLVDRLLRRGLGPSERVPADPARSHPAPAATVARLRRAAGIGGHGPRLDYDFEIGPGVRAIVLDLVDRRGGSAGRVSAGQAAWLRARLAAAGERRVLVFSHHPLESSSGGERLLRLLDRDPRVLATIAGHGHENRIEPRPAAGGGYWQIETASLTDYPQQTRAFRLLETEDGGIAIETWMLDGAPGELPDVARRLAYLDAGGGRPQGAAGEAEDRNVILYR